MKTFLRSNRNKVFAGVCGGLSEYTGIDLTLIRLAFVISAFMGGAGIGIYILLWICTPLRHDYDTDDNIEDTPYTDVSEKTETTADADTVSDHTKDYNHENHQGRTDYERYGNRRANETNGNPYRKQTETRHDPFENTDHPSESKGGATFFGIILFLLGLFWLGDIFNLFHFQFRALFKLWPLILCFAGLNLIPMKRPVRITLNTLLFIAVILLILYVGFCPEACGHFSTSHFNCFWN